jgi:hypothetical protein
MIIISYLFNKQKRRKKEPLIKYQLCSFSILLNNHSKSLNILAKALIVMFIESQVPANLLQILIPLVLLSGDIKCSYITPFFYRFA